MNISKINNANFGMAWEAGEQEKVQNRIKKDFTHEPRWKKELADRYEQAIDKKPNTYFSISHDKGLDDGCIVRIETEEGLHMNFYNNFKRALQAAGKDAMNQEEQMDCIRKYGNKALIDFAK